MKNNGTRLAIAALAFSATLILTPAANAAALITRAEAKAIALDHAGLTEAGVTRLIIEYDIDDGRPEYEVEFRVGRTEYEYDIDARTGRILSVEVDQEKESPVPTPPATGATLTQAQAKAIALSHAGLAESDVTRLTVRYDRDDRRPEYEVQFYVGNKAYEYDIDARTGRVLSVEVEQKKNRAVSSATTVTLYDGIATDDTGAIQGTVSLTVKATVHSGPGGTTTNLALKAKAVLRAATLNFAASGWAGTQGSIAFASRSGETLDLHVSDGQFFGTLEGGSVPGTLTVRGSQNAFSNKADPAAQAKLNAVRGYYTAALLEQSADGLLYAPAGYLTLNIKNQGAVTVAGKLADGTAVSRSAKLLDALDEDGQLAIILHQPLYAKKGAIGGVFLLDPRDRVLRASDTITWDNRKPSANFTRALNVTGGWYSAGLARDTAYVFSSAILSGLPAPSGGTWDEAAVPSGLPLAYTGTRFSLPKNSATLTYAPRTGIFKGRFNLYYDCTTARGTPARKTAKVAYSGIVTPTRDAALADLPLGLGAGQLTVNRQNFELPVTIQDTSTL